MSQSGTDGHVVKRSFEFAVYSVVRLVRDTLSADGPLPRGSVGFVMDKSANGSSYKVEFETPFHTVTTVVASDLVAASDTWGDRTLA